MYIVIRIFSLEWKSEKHGVEYWLLMHMHSNYDLTNTSVAVWNFNKMPLCGSENKNSNNSSQKNHLRHEPNQNLFIIESECILSSWNKNSTKSIHNTRLG